MFSLFNNILYVFRAIKEREESLNPDQLLWRARELLHEYEFLQFIYRKKDVWWSIIIMKLSMVSTLWQIPRDFFLVFVKHKATFVRNIPPHLHHECDSWRHLAKLSWNDSDDTDVVSSHSSIFTSYVIYFNTVIIAIPVWMNVKF